MRITGAVDPAHADGDGRGARGRRRGGDDPGCRAECGCGWRPATPTCARASTAWRCWCRRRSQRDPHGGHLFVFRGRRGELIKVLWHDGQGMCLFAKRLERGRFVWPSTVPRDGADRGDDHAGAAGLSAGRHRLAAAAAHLASAGGRLIAAL